MKGQWHLLLIIAVVSFLLYRYIDAQNGLLKVQRSLPILAEEVRALQEENLRLAYLVSVIQSPVQLWQQTKRPEFGHLQFPRRNVVFSLTESSESGEWSLRRLQGMHE